MTAAIFGAASSGLAQSMFSATSFAGNSSSRTITTGLDNDIVWIKTTTQPGVGHYIYDAVRGVTLDINSENANAETTTSGVTSFDTTGFGLGAFSATNDSGQTYISWSWKEADSYLDIVSYTGNGSNRTINHSLGVEPNFIVIKNLDDSADWAVYHSANTANPETDYLNLNNANATADDNTYWNDTLPTSSVFSVGTNNNVNGGGKRYIAYLFANLSTTSGFGSYTGNAGSQSVALGFRPSMFFVRNITDGDDWFVVSGSQTLVWNNSAVAGSPSGIAISDTGFTITSSSDAKFNASGKTYIYGAWK